MSFYQIMSLVGVGGIFSSLWGWAALKFKKSKSETLAVQNGVQALLRDRLLSSYNYCRRQGFADFADRENFEHMFSEYRALGGNGVMLDIRSKFLALPMEEEG